MWGQAAVFLSIGALVALVTAVVGWTIVRSNHDPQPQPREAHQTVAEASLPTTAAPAVVIPPSTFTVQAAPPRTVTVQAMPSTPAVEPEESSQPTAAHAAAPIPPSVQPEPPVLDSAYDERFLDSMRSVGYTITDAPLALRNAHQVCRLFRLGESPDQVNQQLIKATGMSLSDALQFTSGAMLSYPNCA